MSDPLLPDGITIKSGRTLNDESAVCIEFGKLLQLDGRTVSLVLPLRQAKAFGSLVLRQAQEIERHGLRLVSEDNGA